MVRFSPIHFPVVAILLLSPASVRAQNFAESGPEFQRSNPRFLSTFRPIVAKPGQSTVRVLCDGKDTALGMIVGADGWILTKANDLQGNISCQLRDGRTLDARLVGVHYEHDLAMLKIEARDLTPVEWKESKGVQTGNWVACPGMGDDPVAVGIVSVPTRKVEPRTTDLGFLGVTIQTEAGSVRITKIVPKSAAGRAGLLVDDVILMVEGIAVADSDSFVGEMKKRKPGQIVTLRIRRGRAEQDLHAVLGHRPADERSEFQNRLGGELSNRIGGYASILQHDSIVQPNLCGGPIVDLEGKVIGINICRAGRTESWAIPSELVQSLLYDLMSGKYAPRGAGNGDQVEKLRSEVKRAEQNLAALRAALDRALKESGALANQANRPSVDSPRLDPVHDSGRARP